MTNLLPLSLLLNTGRPDSQPVAIRNSEVINFGRFRADVAAAAHKFRSCRYAALACHDSYNFAVGFFGLLHAGSRIMFPQNMQTGTLQVLPEGCDILVDDAAVETLPSSKSVLSPLDATRMALDFYTSGSTGAPNRITKNLAMLEVEIATLDTLWRQRIGEGPVFATVSHQHIYGLTFKLLWPLAIGRPFATEMHALWETLLAELVPQAVIISSPAHMSRLEGLMPLPEHRRPKQIFSAGAPLPFAASQKALEIFGCTPAEIFGSTETGAIATRCALRGDEPWQLLPGMEMRGDEGRLALRSPFVGPDWVTTSDLVEPVPGGFRFLGRADRIAKIEGKRISLAEIEQALEQLPTVQSAAVVVLPGSPECLAAVIVASEEGQLTLSKIGKFRFSRALRKALSGTQEAAGIPRLWRFVDALPRQAMGKRRDADILALFAEEP